MEGHYAAPSMQVARKNGVQEFTPDFEYLPVCSDSFPDFGYRMPFIIEHNKSQHRFETTVESQQCVVDYSLDDNVMTLIHTGVPTEVGGRGIASSLVQTAMDTSRSEGWKVVAACSYAATWVQRHPAYADLMA